MKIVFLSRTCRNDTTHQMMFKSTTMLLLGRNGAGASARLPLGVGWSRRSSLFTVRAAFSVSTATPSTNALTPLVEDTELPATTSMETEEHQLSTQSRPKTTSHQGPGRGAKATTGMHRVAPVDELTAACQQRFQAPPMQPLCVTTLLSKLAVGAAKADKRAAQLDVVSVLDSHVRQHEQQVQSAVQTQLDNMIALNRLVSGWVRANKQRNGSMLPHEHIEKLPEGVGVVHVFAGRNNTICTLTDWRHVPIRTVSGGMCGLKGAHRGTLEAGTRAASAIAAVALRSGFRQVVLNLKGFGRGREPAFRSIVASGLKVLKIAVCS